ncbi:hypothetical protein DFH07DRAFT_1064933 [Mycena maculata]|uniref:Uncharacterized protein n=1 Tax=Mycena maculata TaxID=230809 RepID=A0AAD7I671_9AGAR|nr:hypothetical protein DFH07DRAFT_1064933 [Mycena maculata]
MKEKSVLMIGHPTFNSLFVTKVTQVKETHSKLAGLEDLQRDTSAKLQQSKDRAHEQDVELGKLRTELKAVGSAKEELRSSLEASQQSANKLTQEVHTLTLREAVSKLGAEVKKLSSEVSSREEELRRGNNRYSIRIPSSFSALTLKLAKEQSGDLQERLLMSESAHATKLESATGKLNIEIAVLTEQKTGLQVALTRVTEEVAMQQAGFLGALVETGKDGCPNSKSMVDLSLWMSSSPCSAQKQDCLHTYLHLRAMHADPTLKLMHHRSLPLLAFSLHPLRSSFDMPPVKKSAQVPAVKPPPLQTAHHAQMHKTLAAINTDDDLLTDLEDDVLKSATLGKRSRRTLTSAKVTTNPATLLDVCELLRLESRSRPRR